MAKKGGRLSVVVENEMAVGNQAATRDPALLRSHNITAILSIGCKPKLENDQSGIVCGKITLRDRDGDRDMLTVYDEVVAEMARLQQEGGDGVVLIHCQAGMSRSPVCAAAYLVAKHGLCAEEALGVVAAARPIIRPRASFVEALKSWADVILSG